MGEQTSFGVVGPVMMTKLEAVQDEGIEVQLVSPSGHKQDSPARHKETHDRMWKLSSYYDSGESARRDQDGKGYEASSSSKGTKPDNSGFVLESLDKERTKSDTAMCKRDKRRASRFRKIRSKFSEESSTFSKEGAPKDAAKKRKLWDLKKLVSSSVVSSSDLTTTDKSDMSSLVKPRPSRSRFRKSADEEAWYVRPESEGFHDPEKDHTMDMVFFDSAC